MEKIITSPAQRHHHTVEVQIPPEVATLLNDLHAARDSIGVVCLLLSAVLLAVGIRSLFRKG